ncbi:MAG: glycosyltransferase [Acidobacteriaceae bacterium]|nr:glycosyltransferase [Acidobacteriaceae bacterium]
MRIAILVPMMSGRGGTESAILGLAQGLEGAGDEVRVYFFGGEPRDPRWIQSVHAVILGSRREMRWTRLWRYFFGLAREFRRFRPEAVVALDSLRLLKGKAALALSKQKVPLWSWIHFPVEHIKMGWMLRLADGHLAISKGIAGQLRDLAGPSRADRVATIYNAIPVDCVRVPRPARNEAVEFLHIGRLEFAAQKRVADLLAAAARVRGNFRLTIIGDGPDRAGLEQHGRELGMSERIAWLGWQTKPWDHVSKASVLLLTSSYEGFGIVLVEALARGVPCITSDCKYGPDEIIEHGRNGWLYPVGDVARLAELMQAIVDDPGILPSEEAAWQSAQKFSRQAVTERARFVFASLAKRNPLPSVENQYSRDATAYRD